jgi:hypothetical protein
MSTPISIIAIETNQGVYIQRDNTHSYNRLDGITHLLFDGKRAEPTFHKDWLKIDKKPVKVSQMVARDNINHRFELIDKPNFPHLPDVYQREEVATYDKNEYEWIWNSDKSHLSSLYRLVSDKQEPVEVDVPYTFAVIFTIDKIENYKAFNYPVEKSFNSNREFVTSAHIKHQIIDEIMFPNLILDSRPCALSSKDSYDLIRKHVIENIDPKWATISSNYEFCFKVEKKIELCKPLEHKREATKANGRSYRPPRWSVSIQTAKTVTIFEMTHEGDRYKGYTPVPGFCGENADILKQNIDAYLKELMLRINEPLKECPHCNGSGILK